LENVAEIIPVRVEVSEISEKYEGEYIKITGLVIETSGDNFVVGTKNSDEKIKVNIRDSANIDKPKMRKGDKVEIAGIVSEYKGEYRILPTKQEDVKVLTSDHLPMAGPSEILSLIFGTIIYTLWILFQKVRKRRLAWVPNWQQI
jgi:DNA/RNA endonuclease YhcR with UshA esterase domain